MSILTGHRSKYGSHLDQLNVRKEELVAERMAMEELPTDEPDLRDKRSSLTREINKVRKAIEHELLWKQEEE